MDINSKWSSIKKEKLCFCCLGDDHHSKDCKKRRKYELQDCDKDNHKLLHFKEKDDSIKRKGDGVNGQDVSRSTRENKEMDQVIRHY